MKKQALLFLLFIYSSAYVFPQIVIQEPLSERITCYNIDAKLDPAAKTVTGKMDAFWVNNSNDIVDNIQLHLYMNAFRSSRSTFYQGTSQVKDTTIYGRIDITSFSLADGTDLMPLIKYISPDDGNPFDSTVVKIDLPRAAAPGDTVSIKAGWTVKLPGRIRRTGYNDDFFFVAQWFPKFGVYEPAGMRYRVSSGWNCHQFHPNSEFYSNHSVYDVKITVPDNYVVGSGGLQLSESDCSDDQSYKTLTIRAEDIVDFAWTAWPGYQVYTDQWKHVKISLYIAKERAGQVERQFRAVKSALEYLTENVGPYPWPHLACIDPPAKGSGSTGMEYTTLFTSMSIYGMPGFIHLPEMVTVHEFGHAYFMGILASNEFEDPWMDEGINSFWEARIMDHYWGERSGMIDHPLIKVPDKTTARSSYIYSPNNQVVSNKENSWSYPLGTYSMMSYNKASTWLFTLMGIIGEETMNDVFREYYRRWAFKHPAPGDFIDVVNEVVRSHHGEKFGKDMGWFFDQTLYGTGLCDYKVATFNSFRNDTSRPRVDTTAVETAMTVASDSLYRCVAGLQRLGEVMLPVDVLIHFSSGNEQLVHWDGRDRYKKLEIMSNSEIEWVKIDPDYKIRMDANFINNSLTSEPDRVPVRRLTNKILFLLQFFVSAVTL